MSENCGSYYKISRLNAGLTQESAAEVLEISTRTLSDYENLRTSPPDSTVVAMAEAYRTPLLVHWHLKHNSPYGDYLPEFMEVSSLGDSCLQAVLAFDSLKKSVEDFKIIMEDGKVNEWEVDQYNQVMCSMQAVVKRLMSVTAFAGKGGA